MAFRRLMAGQFGSARAEIIARDHVLAELGGRTVDQALATGYDPVEIWQVVCDAYEIPQEKR